MNIKKCLSVVSAVLTAAVVSARAESVRPAVPIVSEEEVTGVSSLLEEPKHGTDYLMFAIADPIQLLDDSCDVKGLRMTCFYGRCHNMYGLDLGLVAHTDLDFAGLGLTAFNWNGNDVDGIQIAAFSNVTFGNMNGVQLAGVSNYGRGNFTGLTVSTVNALGSISGVQFGAVNWNKSSCRALEVGVGNFNNGDFTGCAIGGVNYTDRFTGVQIGAINIANEMGNGVQLGVFNAAMNFRGIQIGALNLIANSPIAILPIVNAIF